MVGNAGDVEVLAGVGGRGGVGLDEAGQANGVAGLLELAIDTQVMLPKGAGAHNDDVDATGCEDRIAAGHYLRSAGVSTASRQRV